MSYKAPHASITDYGVVKVGTGIDVTNGVISTSLAPSTNFGFFYDTTPQLNPVASGINTMTLNTTSTANQVSIVAGTQITVANAGTYNKIFTVSLQKVAPGAPTIASIWLRRNGVDIPESTQEIEVPNQIALLFVSGGYTLDLLAGDNIQMMWSSPDISVQLAALPVQAAPIRPGTPSVKVTLTRIR